MFKNPTPSSLPVVIAAVLLLSGCAREPFEPRVITLDPDEAAREAQKIQQEVTVEVVEGLELDLWASEKLLADPVGLDIDDQGRAFVTITSRSSSSEFDIRAHPDWVNETMTFETVEDRRDFLHRELSPERSAQNADWLPDRNEDGSHDWRDLTVEKEEVYRIEDRSGDGVADYSQRYIKGFHDEITDVAGAILYHDGAVFLGVGPDMWKLQDTDGDGMADSRTSISHGYAVHIGFSGHGMSGAIQGPDGRIYWGIGDVGANITDQEGNQWAYPNTGIIVRSNPDGSDFEVFAYGVRNTHEFEFDKHGNLISVDNDGDHAGESERIVHLINGSDSGWRNNWQFGKYTDPKNNEYNVWMDEAYFKPRHEGQTAHILPPVALYHSGPAGMAYNPGTALNEEWEDYFFVAEFVGSPARSRIHGFTLEPKGATFELAQERVIQQGILATGLDFGPDGALYFADWIDGWDTKGEGRIWKLDTSEKNAALRRETQSLLAEDFSRRSEGELLELLQHQDMRVRMNAQFELAERGDTGAQTLLEAIEQTGHQLARIHGIWGIGQLAREDTAYAKRLVPFLQDDDPEIRAQTAKVLGDAEYEPAAEAIIPLLKNEEARPRLYAAQALGQIGYHPAIEPILDMLEANNDEDAYLRFAGALALARIGDPEPIVALHDHPSRALRMAAVIALKRMQHPGVARFLDDEDVYIVTDAARAIGDDQLIEEALPPLAALLETPRFDYEPLIRRVINANLYVGGREAARRVTAYAARTEAPEAMRAEAIRTLGVWPTPSIFDRVTGRHRGPIERDPSIVQQAIQPVMGNLLTDESDAVQIAAAETAGQLHYEEAIPTLSGLLADDASPEVRIAALQALYDLGYEAIDEAIQLALDDESEPVRMTALEMIPTLTLPAAQRVELLASVLGSSSIAEQQSALEALGTMQHPDAQAVLEAQVDQLVSGTLPPELQLDVMMAVEASHSAALQARIEEYRAAKPADDPVAAYSASLRGGTAERGREIFYRHQGAQCVRCHAIDGRGGDVGPDLRAIGSTLTREQLLESLVAPGARIAPGYGTLSITLENGDNIRGIVQEETDAVLVLQTADGAVREVNKSDIARRENAPSSMPPMGTILTRAELRDLVAFLSTLGG